MRRSLQVSLCVTFLCSLAACGVPGFVDGNPPGSDKAYAYQTVAAFLTETARPYSLTQTVAFEVTSTPTPRERITRTPTRLVLIETQPVSMTQTGEGPTPTMVPCDQAAPGRPLDVSVPDDTRFRPGDFLSKTWRLHNAGSCAWTTDYAVVWFSGSRFGLVTEQRLNSVVPPGSSVDITIDFIAPDQPGVYQSNWKLRNVAGTLFGIGPGGKSPFWVRIDVIELNTATPAATFTNTPTFTPTSTSVVTQGPMTPTRTPTLAPANTFTPTPTVGSTPSSTPTPTTSPAQLTPTLTPTPTGTRTTYLPALPGAGWV